ncbi:unnamed protein product [Periconia digitata]|uniref:Ribosomal protein L11 n=1 Tax=Periconia digitata TaxID=1303443 RepID=A0A9W4UFV5_9PLEO|nr:unnamed protein product [Periconia digitata]
MFSTSVICWRTYSARSPEYHFSTPVAAEDARALTSELCSYIPASSLTMAKRALPKEQMVKLIVGAGQASPSPPVGPALGSKGVKSMDFCKEFNARTAQYITGTPIPALITVRPDRSFHFQIRTPPTATMLLTAAGAPMSKSKVRGAGNVPGPMNNQEGQKGKTSNGSPTNGHAAFGTVGTVSLKHVYEIARIKQSESRLKGLSLEGLARSVVGQAASLGVVVVP